VILYLILSLLAVKVFTGDAKNIKWVFYAYGIVLLLSLITYTGGYLLNNFPKGFLFTRNLLGLLQSPFITMIIIPALKLENTDKIK
jgi:surface polysaccharide O-acyltransferase-like enzyme